MPVQQQSATRDGAVYNNEGFGDGGIAPIIISHVRKNSAFEIPKKWKIAAPLRP